MSPLEFNLRRRSSPFYGYPKGTGGRGGYRAIAIVNHITDFVSANGWEPFDRWFTVQGGVAPNYCILRTGEITQYVDDDDAAWTQGRTNRPDTTIPWVAELVVARSGVNPNLLCISIEHEGMPDTPITESQYQASLWLHKRLIQRHGIQVDNEHIIGHYVFDSVDRARCWPGYPYSRLFADLREAA